MFLRLVEYGFVAKRGRIFIDYIPKTDEIRAKSKKFRIKLKKYAKKFCCN